MIVFLDSNVLLDVLIQREPHYAESARVWELAEKRVVKSLVSALSFTNIHYITGKALGKRHADHIVKRLASVFPVAACDEWVISQAAAADTLDFEDAVQLFSAIRGGATCIVTRDLRHFRNSQVPAQSPREFLDEFRSR